LISSVRGRESFRDLYRYGRRVRVGALQITYRANATSRPRLAFSINRSVGNAVVRNRARRRLRAAFHDATAEHPNLVPPGDYVLSVYDGGFDYQRGRQWLLTALKKLAGQ
jgi:ribonuclease P protein component